MWPLYVMFGLVPFWWATGGLYLFWPLFALILAVVLFARGKIEMPSGSTTWMVMAAVVLVSVTRLDRVTGLPMFLLRLGFMLSALLVYLYVYNALRAGASWDRVFRPLCLFWLSMVALGWIGVFAQKFTLTTPVEMLLPHSITADRGVQAMVHVHATEFNPLGRNQFFRTAAPYPYTNNWGTGFAVLVPCVIAYLTSIRTGGMRVLLLISLPLSLIPAFLTLNRGMFIGLGAGLVYLGLRALMRGDVRLIGSIVGVAVLAWVATLVVPVEDLIANRVDNTDSTTDRADLYLQTLGAVGHSPILGYGGPRLVDTTSGAEPLGTQGQMWLVMYSHGIPALLLFLAFWVVVARRMAAAVTSPGKWLSTVPVIALVVTPFYGFTDINLSVMFFAIGLGMAALDGPVRRPPPPDATTPASPVRPPPQRARASARAAVSIKYSQSIAPPPRS
ncbi:hypothetical protein GCM10012284_41280 [Mangrovihabitans endophyticus]|uniref:O-antigen ligase-related domain-containing protein n=2 Tax=Mangrovihabitans endophyticus TaxID=1751298 RepID=A0A8J3C2Z2_9ACTN|nr:hypothetical protein GCM10012284_41280 [Mangrovihabitans endophyticus]